MRLLKFISVFVATALFLVLFIIGLNWDAFNTFLDNREAFMEGTDWVPKTQSLRGLTEFIDENPHRVSVASIVLDHPDSTIYFEADTPRTMGTLSNLLLLTAYAIEIENDAIDPDTLLDLTEINSYILPQVDNSVHSEAFHYAGRNGWINDNQIGLNHALRVLARYNDLALADHLWWELDPSVWGDLKDQLNLEFTEMPLPYSGLYTAIAPDLNNATLEEIIENRQNETRSEWREHVIRLSEKYVSDEIWRDTVRKHFEDNRLGISFMQERDALTLFPKTTAREVVHLLMKLWNRDELPPRVSDRVFDWLRTPYTNRPEIERDFTDYGGMFDSRMGLLNGVDFGTLVYTGDTKFQAVFFDQLPIGFWFHMSGNHMHQDFQQRLIYDPALAERMKNIAD